MPFNEPFASRPGRFRLVTEPAPFDSLLQFMDAPGIARLLRENPFDIDPDAADELSLHFDGGSLDTIAFLVATGRLSLLEDSRKIDFFSGGKTNPSPAPPEDASPPPADNVLAWIEVILVDEKDQGIVGEAYRVILPDGTQRTGKLGAGGRVRLDGIPAGTCWVQFPSLGDARPTETSPS